MRYHSASEESLVTWREGDLYIEFIESLNLSKRYSQTNLSISNASQISGTTNGLRKYKLIECHVLPAKLSPFLAEESCSFMKITDPPSLCIAAPNEDEVRVLTS